MANEIIYVCNSTNNKNVREGELEILRKEDGKLFFEFGENEMNIKKRFYNDLETLNSDFEALKKLKEGTGDLPKSEETEPDNPVKPDRETESIKITTRAEAPTKKPYRYNKKFLK